MSHQDDSLQDSSYRSALEEARTFLLERNRFLVVSHVNPDGDAIGSTLAVGQLLKKLGKDYVMVNEGAAPIKFQMLPDWGAILDYRASMEAPPAFDCVITVDCADYARIGDVRQWFPSGIPILNIDHHSTNDGFGLVNVIRADAAATAEVLYDLAETLAVEWEHPLAICVYTGLLTDTGGFRYANTTPKVMRIASEMLQYGVIGSALAEEFLEKVTFAHVAVLQKALSRLSFSPDRRIAWMAVTSEDVADTGASNDDLDGLVNYPRNIEGVEVGLLFKQKDSQTVKVSLRSGDTADVSAVAQRFGGGGHVRASGCAVKGSLQEAIEQVVREVGLALQ